MKILVINGSPRGDGNTQSIVRMVLNTVQLKDPDITTETLFLKEANLKPCIGCHACLSYGEDKCPLKDDRAIIEEKMREADAVIFASPVYVANVTWLLKNYFDRFAYRCHRPDFHNKKAMVLSSTGSVAGGIVNTIMKISVQTWGFDVVSAVSGIITPEITAEDQAIQHQKNKKAAEKGAVKLYKALTNDNRNKRAGMMKLYAFQMQKTSFKHAHPEQADYNFWREKGWLDPECQYYVRAKIPYVQNWIAGILAKRTLKKYPLGKWGR